jgi:hypothetical protein
VFNTLRWHSALGESQNGWLVREVADPFRLPLAASITDDFGSLMSSGDDLNLYPKGIEAINSGIRAEEWCPKPCFAPERYEPSLLRSTVAVYSCSRYTCP